MALATRRTPTLTKSVFGAVTASRTFFPSGSAPLFSGFPRHAWEKARNPYNPRPQIMDTLAVAGTNVASAKFLSYSFIRNFHASNFSSGTSQTEFTEMAWEGILGAVDYARANKQQIVESEHLMKALLEQKDGLARRIFTKAGLDNTSVLQATDNFMAQQPKVTGEISSPLMGSHLSTLLDNSRKHKKEMGDECVSVEHLLLAFHSDKRFGQQSFKNLQLSERTLKDAIQAIRGSQRETDQGNCSLRTNKLGFLYIFLICIFFVLAGFFGSALFSHSQEDGHGLSPRPRLLESVKEAKYNLMSAGESDDDSITSIPFQVLSWKPRALYFPNFATAEQCESIVGMAKAGGLKPSHLGVPKGETEENYKGYRTSYGVFISASEDKTGILDVIEEKIARATMIPRSHGEAFNILRYEVGQRFSPHYDTIDPAEYGPQKSQRVASFLLYLTDVEEGGETNFPCENGDCIGLKVWTPILFIAPQGYN